MYGCAPVCGADVLKVCLQLDLDKQNDNRRRFFFLFILFISVYTFVVYKAHIES